MPPIASRLVNSETEHGYHAVAPTPHMLPAPPMVPDSWSPAGNPAPTRDILPIEYMYDFHTNRIYPESPYFTRGLVDVNSLTRNTALLALSKTTKIL